MPAAAPTPIPLKKLGRSIFFCGDMRIIISPSIYACIGHLAESLEDYVQGIGKTQRQRSGHIMGQKEARLCGGCNVYLYALNV
jgi:hypothetical protein